MLHVLHLLQAHSNICFLKGYMEKDGTLSEYSGISYPILWIYDHTWSDYGKSFCLYPLRKYKLNFDDMLILEAYTLLGAFLGAKLFVSIHFLPGH